MHCELNACKQGRESCDRAECLDEPISSPERMAWAAAEVVCGLIVFIALAAFARFVWANWNVVAALMAL